MNEIIKDPEIPSALIALSGVIISVTLSLIVNAYKNKTEILKIHSWFISQLYSKRLKLYLKIFELISAYIKIIKNNGIFYEELNIFNEEYSKLDSKSSLLFSYTTPYSAELMIKLRELLKFDKTHVFSEKQKKNLIKKLAIIETTMKLELGIYNYKDPVSVFKKIHIPLRKKEMIKEIKRYYSTGKK